MNTTKKVAATQRAGAALDRVHPVRRAAALGFWFVVAGVVAVSVATVGVPLATGAQALVVKSGSMEPALPIGSAVIVRPEPVESIEIGDVITFTDPGAGDRLVTHRVVAIERSPDGPRFTTKGDANEDPDPGTVPADDVRGVLWYQVPFVGTVTNALTSPAGWMYGAGLVLIVLAGHLLVPRTAPRPRGPTRLGRGDA